MFSRTATCKYNYPAVPFSLWLATHAPCAAVPLPSLTPYLAAVSNLIPRLFSPILSLPSNPPGFLFPPNHQNTSSPPRRSVLFWALRPRIVSCLFIQITLGFPILAPLQLAAVAHPLPYRGAFCPYSSRTSLAVFTLIVAVLLNPLRIVCTRAKDAAVVQRKLRFENAGPRYPHPPPRYSVHLSVSRPRDWVSRLRKYGKRIDDVTS